jgi:hypothetical protein
MSPDSKLVNIIKATNYVGIKRRSYRLNRTLHTGNTRNPPKCLCWTIRLVNPAWTSLPSGLSLSQHKSENYCSLQCRLSGKISVSYVGTIQRIYLSNDDFYSDCTLVLCLISVDFFCFILTLANGLCCAWFVYPILCWSRCSEIGTGSIDWAKLSRIYLKTETESGFRNLVF